MVRIDINSERSSATDVLSWPAAGKDDEIGERDGEFQESEGPTGTASMPGAFRPKTVLIVDDNRYIAELIQEALAMDGDYHAVIAYDAAEALETVQCVRTDLILLDLMLPGLPGLALYDLLKADPQTRDIPIIVVTASPTSQGLEERGLSGLIAKPFSLEELAARVNAVLRA
jgi:CheY-like chemotaxis protein